MAVAFAWVKTPGPTFFFRFPKEVPVIFLCAILLLAYLRPEL